ncbi:hypothetical protein EYC84_011591, partial [Monilinia fructicola]
MFRNALKQSSRTVGAISASGRIATRTATPATFNAASRSVRSYASDAKASPPKSLPFSNKELEVFKRSPVSPRLGRVFVCW